MRMSELTQAKLVLVEPGVAAEAAMADVAEHNHVLLLGRDESPAGFRERVRRRAEALRSRAQRVCDVAYVVSEQALSDWQSRLSLLAEVCDTVAPDGQLQLFAPSTARSEALGCLGDLQASVAPGLRLRAVFTEAQAV